MTRSALLSIFLVVAIVLVGWNIYESWHQGPWDLPSPTLSEAAVEAPVKPEAPPLPVALNTDGIVAKNLFDPERGAGASREAEETSRAAQRVRNLILMGTVIIGGNRTAILQEGGSTAPAPAGQAQPPSTMRLRVGETVEGYTLSEIGDKRVVFTKDASRIELALDYFRKVEVASPRVSPPRPGTPATGPGVAPTPAPRVIPNLPRRGRLPGPGTPPPES